MPTCDLRFCLLGLSCCLLSFSPECSGYHLLVSVLITLICSMHERFDLQPALTSCRYISQSVSDIIHSCQHRCTWPRVSVPGTKLLIHSCTVLHVCSSWPLSGSCDLQCSFASAPSHQRHSVCMDPGLVAPISRMTHRTRKLTSEFQVVCEREGSTAQLALQGLEGTLQHVKHSLSTMHRADVLTRRSAPPSHTSAGTCAARPAVRMLPGLGRGPGQLLALAWRLRPKLHA